MLENEDKLFENFISMYYSQTPVPKEILVNLEFWQSQDDKEVLEKYLFRKRGSKVILHKPLRGEKKHLVELAQKNAELNFGDKNVLHEVKKKLDLPKLPRVIECFDMSNLGHEYLVGAMTRWVDLKPDKNGYRRFEIKTVKGKQDDFAAMREVVFRRYSRLKDQQDKLPDLIIIDGGKGQLGVALDALETLKLTIPIISIAKGEKRDRNEIHMPNKERPFIFDDNSKMMLFLRNVRDSVHNYVIAYNRKKREMKLKEEMKK